MDPIEFSLIENAEDSLGHAVNHLTIADEHDDADLKRAILDVAHVVELILKEKLRLVHPAFILKDIDNFPFAEAETISTHKAVRRLQNFAGIILSERNKKTIKSCRKLRNTIEHYEVHISREYAQVIIGRILSFIFSFTRDHLDIDWEEQYKDDEKWYELIRIREFFDAHLPIMEEKLAEIDAEYCSECGGKTVNPDTYECIFCGCKEELITCGVCGNEYPEDQIVRYRYHDAVPDFCICYVCRESEDR